MEIKIQLDSRYSDPEVHILTAEVTEEVQQLLRRLSEESPHAIVCYDEDSAVLVEQEQLIRIYGANQKVYAQTELGEFTLRRRLYEMEELLDSSKFVRISNSEIVNLRYVRRLDLSITGTIGMQLKNGETAYVSRRYLSRIKAILHI